MTYTPSKSKMADFHGPGVEWRCRNPIEKWVDIPASYVGLRVIQNWFFQGLGLGMPVSLIINCHQGGCRSYWGLYMQRSKQHYLSSKVGFITRFFVASPWKPARQLHGKFQCSEGVSQLYTLCVQFCMWLWPLQSVRSKISWQTKIMGIQFW